MIGIIILYTSIGGLAAVAFTDTFMVIGIVRLGAGDRG